MQLTAKLKNKATGWSANLKPRVGDVVLFNGTYYANTSGVNTAVSNVANWFPIESSQNSQEIDKAASDIGGTDPNYQIDLSSDGAPAFPISISVYVDQNNTGNYLPLSPVNYNPVTRVLGGLSSPVDYPNQKIKIMMI